MEIAIMVEAKTAYIKSIVVKALYGGIKGVYLTIANMFGAANTVTDVDNLTPYGQASIPPKGLGVIAIPVEGSAKKLFVIGGVSSIPEINHELISGESWNYSQFYVLVMQNDAIRAYRIGEGATLDCTLPNGEAFVQLVLNRINEQQAEIDYLKGHKHLAGEYVANGSPVTGNSGPPTTMPPQPATMAKDKAYLSGGKALINNTGVNYQ